MGAMPVGFGGVRFELRASISAERGEE